MSFLTQEPSSIAKILDASFKLYKKSFIKIMGFSIIIGILEVGVGLASNMIELKLDLITGLKNLDTFFLLW